MTVGQPLILTPPTGAISVVTSEVTGNVTDITGDVVTVASRGADGTSAQTVTTGWDVAQGITAGMFDGLLKTADATATFAARAREPQRAGLSAQMAALRFTTGTGVGVNFPAAAAPPTITNSGPAGAGITGITDAVNTPLVTSSVVTGPVTLTGPYTTAYQSQAGYVGPASLSGTGNETCPLWIEFDTDAPTIDIYYIGSASPQYRLVIDGEAITSTAYATANGSSGVFHVLRIDNADKRQRHILIDSGSMGIISMSVGPTDTLSPSGVSRPRLALIGDSYTVNDGGAIGLCVARKLGLGVWADGSGGTGYNNAQGGADGKATFVERVPAVMAASVPDALVFYGGINDSTGTLQADCLAAITAARAVRADLPIVIVGSQNAPSAAGSAATKSALLKAAAAAGGAAYVDPVTGHIYDAAGVLVQHGSPWITGTGNTGATTGVGNADIYITADGTHPSSTAGVLNGYDYHGLRLAQALRVALPVAV